MIVDGENLIVSCDEAQDEIEELYDFIKPRLEYIDSITVESDVKLASSLLLQLLVSIKKSKPSIQINLLDGGVHESKFYGTMHWSHL